MSLNRSSGIIIVLIVGFVAQMIFSFMDKTDSPEKAVAEFSKAYFSLDPSMAKRICKKRLTSGDENVVKKYIYLAGKKAKDRGFDINFIKNRLYHIEMETIMESDSQAQVGITAKRRVAIHPLYAIVATIFNIGKTYSVNEIIHVIKENGRWKVCGKLYSLPGN